MVRARSWLLPERWVVIAAMADLAYPAEPFRRHAGGARVPAHVPQEDEAWTVNNSMG
jgi:hypothetical protein